MALGFNLYWSVRQTLNDRGSCWWIRDVKWDADPILSDVNRRLIAYIGVHYGYYASFDEISAQNDKTVL